MSNIAELSAVPELSFNGGLEYATLLEAALGDYNAKITQLTGAAPELGAADPRRLILQAGSYVGALIGAKLDAAAKSCFLKYATGEALDNLGAFKRVERRGATYATTVLRFSMADARTSATPIPGGTRVTNAAGGLYFATDTYTEIPVGQLFVDVAATATVSGAAANGFGPGALGVVVDLVPYVPAVTNLTSTAGGADVQSDDDYTRAIYNAPVAYSVAGPSDAYEYHALQSRTDIDEVSAYTPEPGVVNIVFTLDGGMPGEQDVAQMQEYLSDETIRPMTDTVRAMAPTEAPYNINMTYWVDRSKANQAVAIQTAVNDAVAAYIKWQRKIGRDIAPEKLIQLVMAAGAKRMSVTEPVTTTVEQYNLAACGMSAVTYGGLEDD